MTKHQVQWAAQFAVGAELARRGYSVAFFLGNEPGHDLLCAAQNDCRIQVKSFSWKKPKSNTAKGDYVLIKDLRTGDPSDVIIIVHVPELPDPFEFFIATREELQDAAPEIAINPKTNKQQTLQAIVTAQPDQGGMRIGCPARAKRRAWRADCRCSLPEASPPRRRPGAEAAA